ncbi:type I restriction-modification system subunit M [Micromonospora sp. L31]|uniref:type I restriction-modification system subunit M n=1 Tax=Micromonospora sp. L31 TaxID=3452213 RepID=UPI003F8A8EC6
MPSHTELANLIWSVADLLRGDYRQSEYGKVILPFTVLRRMDCVMAPTREKVWARAETLQIANQDFALRSAAKLRFYNLSRQSFATIGADAPNVVTNLNDYLNGFSANAREIIDKYDFRLQVNRLHSAGLLYKVVQRFADVDLSLTEVDNHQMGYVFEELIRKFSEFNTAGEHFTPREVIELMVNLLIAPDADRLTGDGDVINILDPACGTGGILSAADNRIKELNPDLSVFLFGQELNAESYAICRSDMMITDHDEEHIVLGNSFSDDGHAGRTFDYMLANPPFGVEWKKVQEAVVDEHEAKGHAGRFGAGLPRINDGSLLFLQHMLSKMNPPDKKGSRVAIVFNGSPLFTGAAGSGESEIRRWILENDWLEGIVALPDQLFYNTGISTYFWILTNRKAREHKGKVVLLDAREHWARMRKSLGEKRKLITEAQISEITRLYADALHVADDPKHPLHGKVKVFDNRDFGYQRIAVDRPLRQRFEISDDTLAALAEAKPLLRYAHRDALLDAIKSLLGTVWWTRAEAKDALTVAVASAGVLWPVAATEKAIWASIGISDPDGEVQTDRKGNPLPDPDLRDYENVPLVEDIDEYFAREVRPHVPDAWIAEIKDAKTGTTSRARIGYEIPFTRHFYVYTPPRPLAEIDAELRELEAEIQKLLSEVTA